jgi:phenylacetate-CoA ligase
MIRYRTRDLTRLLPGTARTMRRMEKITGRSDDMIILRGVNVFPTQIEEQVLRVRSLTPHFEIVLSRDGRLDEMTVRVERAPAAESLEEAASHELQHHIKSVIGVSAHVAVCEPNSLPRSEGKAKRVIDKRPKG